jgi:hypothetical protein
MRVFICAVALAWALSGCDDPMATDSPLQGSWITTDTLQPQGFMRRTLSFGSGGAFAFRVQLYGMYDRSNSLSAYIEQRGRFTVENDKLHFDVSEITTWDAFYRNSSPETSHVDYTLFDDCSFRLLEAELVLNYTSYPADAPEATVLQFRRAQ